MRLALKFTESPGGKRELRRIYTTLEVELKSRNYIKSVEPMFIMRGAKLLRVPINWQVKQTVICYLESTII